VTDRLLLQHFIS